jgi:WD40 repeat protein
VLRGQENWVYSVAFSADGKLLASGGWDGSVIVWRVSNGDQVAGLVGHSDIVLSVAFAPQGNRLATAGYDQTVRLWEL